MTPYILLFAIVAVMAWQMKMHLGWLLLLGLALFVGLRHEVGGDWFTYIEIYESYANHTEALMSAGGDFGYALLNRWSHTLGWGVYGVNFFSALIFCYGLLRFCQAQPLPALALAVSIPYLVIVVAMGYTRQGVAIGLGMLALLALQDQRWGRFAFWVLLASLFHKTAVVLFGFGLLLTTGGWWWRLPLLALVAGASYQTILADRIDFLLFGYEQQAYQSQGAAIRVAMNVLPALMFLFWRRRFGLSESEYKLWSLVSYGALAMIVVLNMLASSTAADRLALYFIPLQLFVWSRLPIRDGRLYKEWIVYVLLYSFTVMMVWLLFAGHAYIWLPYQFYPLVWLFS